MFYKTKMTRVLLLIISCSTGLTGCGGGGSSSTPSAPTPAKSSFSSASSLSLSSASSSSSSSSSSSAIGSEVPVNTTYRVTIETPEDLLRTPTQPSFPQKVSAHIISEKAVGKDALTASNFAVTCVDLAGAVIDIVPLTENSISPNDDGSWNISTPLAPTVNCLAVINVYQPVVLREGESVKDNRNIYAPVSAESFKVSPPSTAAFNILIEKLGGSGTFHSAGVDPQDPAQIAAIDNAMTNVTALLADQNFSELTLSELPNAIELALTPVIEQEVQHIRNPIATTAVELIRDNGGMYNFSSRWQGIYYTALVGDSVSFKDFIGGTFVSRETRWGFGDYVLSSTGWEKRLLTDRLVSYNADGSVTFADSGADADKTVYQVTQGFSLFGSNIAEVLLSNDNTTHVSEIVKPDAVFSEGAIGYRISINYPPKYSIFVDTGDANGICFDVEGMLASAANGNCNYVEMRRDSNIFERPVAAYSSLFSADVHINSPGSRALTLGTVDGYRLDAQVINNSERSVKYYARSWEGTDHADLIATGTWNEITLPVSTGHNLALELNYPPSVLAIAEIWSGQNHQIYTVQDGFVRTVTRNSSWAQPSGTLVFNSVARDDIMNSLISNQIDQAEQ